MADDVTEVVEQQEEKKFTQTELDALIGRRLAEERKKFPTQEEMTEFNSWKAGKTTDAEKLASITSERDTANSKIAEAQAEIQKLKHERYLLDKGIAADDLDYYEYKISKKVTDTVTFEKAAEEFLKENNKRSTVKMDTGASIGGKAGKPAPNDQMNALIRGARK